MREVIQWDHALYIHINGSPIVSYLCVSRLLYLPSNNFFYLRTQACQRKLPFIIYQPEASISVYLAKWAIHGYMALRCFTLLVWVVGH